MARQRFVWVCGWTTFQHYAKRNPVWVKNYTRLLHDDDYLSLSGHRRAVLHGVWLAFATSNRRLLHDTRTLSARLVLKVTTADLKALNDAGFIEVLASRTLDERLRDASPLKAEAEAETEEEKEQVVSEGAERREPDPVYGLPISVDKELELTRLLHSLRGVRDDTLDALRRAAEGVPFGGIVRVRESVERKPARTFGVGYAVKALHGERQAA